MVGACSSKIINKESDLIHIDLLADVEFFDAFAEGGSGDAEEGGGFDLVASGFFEGLLDEFAFYGGDELLIRIGACPLEHRFGQVVDVIGVARFCCDL